MCVSLLCLHLYCQQIVSIVTVAYLSVCAYYTVFKIKVFNLYYLSASHSTDEYSLLFSAMWVNHCCPLCALCCVLFLCLCCVRLLSRLALPICLNYLYMINVVQLSHRDDSVPTTAFTKVCGVLRLIRKPVRATITLYPIGRPVRALDTIILYCVEKPTTEPQSFFLKSFIVLVFLQVSCNSIPTSILS